MTFPISKDPIACHRSNVVKRFMFKAVVLEGLQIQHEFAADTFVILTGKKYLALYFFWSIVLYCRVLSAVLYIHCCCDVVCCYSVAGAAAAASLASRHSDPWDRRRRSSTLTARYSLLDALDLEYALLRAAARGSVGPYSLSESLHKLTFTQSLAFPALARGLAAKRRPSQVRPPPLDPADSGLNAFAKIVTALVLMLVSVLVFCVVYKFVRT